MDYLGMDEAKLRKFGAIHTAREIQQQPEVWMKIYKLLKEKAKEIGEFMREALEQVDEVILTGAGTSAYIGIALMPAFRKHTKFCVHAFATTDLVTHPGNYFNGRKKVLLISFARSGNSPESCAAVNLAEELSAEVWHLIITCNASGDLLKSCSHLRQYNIILPEETNDRGLAMTSSFTGMLLAGLLVTRSEEIEKEEKNIELLVHYGKRILFEYTDVLAKVSGMEFDRAVFLGSGPLQGTAIESHLKLQELTDGNVICIADSFLGLRHGPKAAINNNTIVIALLSNDPYALAYENDLLEALKKGQRPRYKIAVAETEEIAERLNGEPDLMMILSDTAEKITEDYLAVCDVLPAQIIGTFKSMELGLHPDNPSATGAISRVVEGVTIYSFKESYPIYD